MVKPLRGIVVSNKMMKSVTVMVERIYKHPKWGKYVKGRKKYMVRQPFRPRFLAPPRSFPFLPTRDGCFKISPTSGQQGQITLTAHTASLLHLAKFWEPNGEISAITPHARGDLLCIPPSRHGHELTLNHLLRNK